MKTERRKVSDLSNDPANARKHNEKNIDAIIASLRRFGQQKPIVIDRNNIVRAGNGTLEAARRLQWETINCVVTELNGSDAVAYAIADNRTAELAEWDEDTLAAQLGGLLSESEEIAIAAGFTPEEIEAMLALAEGKPEISEDEVPDTPVDPITKPGDLWILGDHRLLCGSCLDMTALQKLFKNEKARMVFTDPPYNVNYTGGTKEALTIKNDSMSDGDFLQFLKDAFISMGAFTDAGSACYVCHADSEGKNFRQAFAESGFLFKQCLVWIKNSLVLGRQDYHWRHEPILYGWKDGGAHRFYADRKQSTVIDDTEAVSINQDQNKYTITISLGGKTVVIEAENLNIVYSSEDEFESAWRFDKPSKNGEHPTMKPIRLVARAIQHGSKKGEIVLDGFLGSGSTLIAAEQTGRICYGTELDPRYCDVIVKRWENLTGRQAFLEDNQDG